MFNLNDANYYQYAIQGLKTKCTSEIEFRLLLKHIVYIKRLIKKYKDNFINININLLLNHYIILYNEIEVPVVNHILIYDIDEIFYPQLKTILMFLNKIQGHESYIINDVEVSLTIIPEDNKLKKILNKIVSNE